jgi:hypothetical protein
MLMMATGTALYGMQATIYEQHASTSYAEASWTRTLAEGAAMATLAVVEEGGIPRTALTQNLDVRWQAGGNPRARFSIEYGLPTPLEGMAAPTANPDSARSIELEADNLAFATVPEGLTGYCQTIHDGQAPYGAFRPNIRTGVCRAIYETWGGLGTGTTTTSAGVTTPVRPRTRSVITGIGQTIVPGDRFDSGGERGLHETVGLARGYFDRLN